MELNLAKYTEFYKGKRKKRNYAIIPMVVVLALLSLALVAFYGMQKYAVITKDGVSVELPILSDGSTTVDEEGNTVKTFEPVEAAITFDAADYSRVKATAGENLGGLRAIFVPTADLTEEKITEYASRLKDGNALVFEMKPRTGQLMWDSKADAAVNYGLFTANEYTNALPRIITELKDKGVYLVAQISCCIDDSYASRSTTVALRTSYGANYTDDNGTWLDPYNTDVRTYVVQMTRELYALGFDEVVLADVMHPVIETDDDGKPKVELMYSKEMSTTPGPVNAVCGFALSVAGQLSDRTGKLSIYCNSAPSLVRADDTNGQNAVLFMKMYDRVYYPTDMYAYPYNVQDIAGNVEIGSVNDRLVPVVENYLPDNSSWVLIDVPEEEEEE